MSNIKFGLTNYLTTAAGAILKNGSGGGAPALEETAGFPMSNVMLNDRLILWKSTALFATGQALDFDFGQNRTIDYVSIHGMRSAVGKSVQQCDVYTQAGAYNPGGVWTLFGSFGTAGDKLSTHRDLGLAAGAVTCRSIRYAFGTVVTGMFQTGKFFAGAMADLGYAGDPGLENNEVINAQTVTFPGGATVAFFLGDNTQDIRISLSQIPSATEATLRALGQQRAPFLVLDNRGAIHDVLISGMRIPSRQTAPNPLFQVELDLLGLA